MWFVSTEMGPDPRDVFCCLPPCPIFAPRSCSFLSFHISILVGGLSYYYRTTTGKRNYVYSQVYWNWNADSSWIQSLYLVGRLHKITAFHDLTFAHQDKTNHILLLILIEPSLGHRYQSCHWHGCHFFINEARMSHISNPVISEDQQQVRDHLHLSGQKNTARWDDRKDLKVHGTCWLELNFK